MPDSLNREEKISIVKLVETFLNRIYMLKDIEYVLINCEESEVTTEIFYDLKKASDKLKSQIKKEDDNGKCDITRS